tara:strand:+ start:4945 stop:5637 length:693 start_codon:yes stop_codon:yes gene_type:complete
MRPASRRSFLAGTVGLALIPGKLLALSGSRLEFEVHRDSKPIGMHAVNFHSGGDDLVVDIEIDLEVVCAWVTVYRYSYRNREVWRRGQLVRLDSETHDDGTDYRVSIRRKAETLMIEVDGQFQTVPGHLLTTGYWHPLTIEQDTLIDTQRGGLLDVEHRLGGNETVTFDGIMSQARRFEVSGDLTMTTWYANDGLWSGLAFDAKGSSINYRLRSRPDPATWQSIVAQTGG